MMSSATKLGSLIAEAVADAAQRVMSGKWSMRRCSATAQRLSFARRHARKRVERATRKPPRAKRTATAQARPRARQDRARPARPAARPRAKPPRSGSAAKRATSAAKPARKPARGSAQRARGAALARAVDGGASGGGSDGGERLSGAVFELEAREPRVEAAARVERRVRAFLDDPAAGPSRRCGRRRARSRGGAR